MAYLFPPTLADMERVSAWVKARDAADAADPEAARQRDERRQARRKFTLSAAADRRTHDGVTGGRYCPECRGTGELRPPSPNHNHEAHERCGGCRGYGVV